jgi:protein PhnA
MHVQSMRVCQMRPGWLYDRVRISDPGAQAMAVKDSNGTVLNAGDSVTVIKDLKVRGASMPLKRGTVIKNIRLVEDDDEHVEGNSDKIKGLVLKACFLKKA